MILAAGNQEIYLTAYTYDQPDVHRALQFVAREGTPVRVLFDKKQSQPTRYRDQMGYAIELHLAGATVCFAEGWLQRPFYDEDGKFDKNVDNFHGAMHTKGLLIGDDCIMGSCNWTTCAKTCLETSFKVRMFAADIRAHVDRYWLEGRKIVLGYDERGKVDSTATWERSCRSERSSKYTPHRPSSSN